MKLPTCWSCKYAFKWNELVFVIDGRKKCPSCNNKQFVTTNSKWKTSVLSMLIISFPSITLMYVFDVTFTLFIASLVILFLTTLLLYPFYYVFTDEKQPLV